MADGLEKILETHAKVIEEGYTRDTGQGLRSYAVSNLRGGVGKSSIAFNLTFELSRKHSLLAADVCPQCNLTEMLLGDLRAKVNIYDALQPVILGPAFGDPPEDLSYRVAQHCAAFKGGKASHVIAGNPELFAFPSTLYQQLNMAYAQRNKPAMRKLLHGLKLILDNEAAAVKAERIVIDTSPFYAGGTHLAWCAVDALSDPSDAFVLTDDFHSAGRISGAERIPISELVVRSMHTIEKRRLQVNSSATRYKRELKYLASLL